MCVCVYGFSTGGRVVCGLCVRGGGVFNKCMLMLEAAVMRGC